MTHIQNIPHILNFGITHKNSPSANPDYVTIGDVSLIDNRSSKIIAADNGDILDFSADKIILGDYIPFYFGIKMPMLYVAQIGGNFVEKPTDAQDIIYMACSVKDIVNEGFTYYFSDGHATDNLTTFYDKRKIEDARSILDWNALRAGYWGGAENLNLKRKKQAEFLVKQDIPANLINRYGCYNNTAQEKLIAMGIHPEKIAIIPNAYYQ